MVHKSSINYKVMQASLVQNHSLFAANYLQMLIENLPSLTYLQMLGNPACSLQIAKKQPVHSYSCTYGDRKNYCYPLNIGLQLFTNGFIVNTMHNLF